MMSRPPAILRTLGSLWFAGILLVLSLVAMASATVFESTHGTERAAATFYRSWWFAGLLGLLAGNVLAALVLRFPFSKRQVGFVITHMSILVILAGAMVTRQWGIEGQVAIAENQATDTFAVRQDALTIAKRRAGTASKTVDLDTSIFSGFAAMDNPDAPALSLDDVKIAIKRFMPDSADAVRMVDDNPHARPAVEVSLSSSGHGEPIWIFANQTQTLGPVSATYRAIPNQEEFTRLLRPAPSSRPASKGIIKVEYKGSTYEFPLEACTSKPVSLGQTGCTMRILRYLPHAIVGADHQLTNVSDQPVNPAIEAEFVGPGGPVKRLAFAKYPDFQSSHGGDQLEGLKLIFTAATSDTPSVPVEVLGGPGGELYVRFASAGNKIVMQPLKPGVPIASPWPGYKFSVLRRFDHARIEHLVEPVVPIRKDRVPAILVQLSTAQYTNELWIQKQRPIPLTVNQVAYELTFGDKTLPLGFALALDRFQVGYYPGEQRQRSFESHITLEDPTTGRRQSQVVSMNNPVKFSGYTLYQSSYRKEDGRSVSYLSVAWDPGQPIVFCGYIALMVGMLVVICTRLSERRRPNGLYANSAPTESNSNSCVFGATGGLSASADNVGQATRGTSSQNTKPSLALRAS